MYIYKGELYLEKNHIKLLKKEPEYVKQRYRIVASVLSPRSNVTRQKSAQTLELSKRQFQKGLKRFLHHKLGISRDIHEIDCYIEIYVHWYNNGKYHSAIDTYPEERYSGQRDIEWYNHLVKSLKLEDVLTIKPEG